MHQRNYSAGMKSGYYTKLFSVLSNVRLTNVLLETFKSHNSYVIFDLDILKLLDDVFIAAFCRRGDASIIPLVTTRDFSFSLIKGVLKLKMSPSVYSGFGLAGVKRGRGQKSHFYEYEVDLRLPKFRRNGRLHRRLRSFLQAVSCSDNKCGRVPRHTRQTGLICVVDWLPTPDPSAFSELTQIPDPISFAHYLSPNGYRIIQPMIHYKEGIRHLQLPTLFDTCKEGSQEVTVNAANANAIYHLLSPIAMEIDVDPLSNNVNPCLDNWQLTPIRALHLTEASTSDSVQSSISLLTITGLFGPSQVIQMEKVLRHLVENSSVESQALVLMAARPFQDSSLTSTLYDHERGKPRGGPMFSVSKAAATKLMLKHPSCDAVKPVVEVQLDYL